MKNFLYFIIIFILSCNSISTKNLTSKNDSVNKKNELLITVHTFPDTILQYKIIDTLFKFSFVSKSADYIDFASNHKQEMSFDIDTLSGNIFVRLGYRVGGAHFETYYSFLIDPKTYRIKIIDPKNADTALNIEDYIKRYPKPVKYKILN